jgi:hypothetical protein
MADICCIMQYNKSQERLPIAWSNAKQHFRVPHKFG